MYEMHAFVYRSRRVISPPLDTVTIMGWLSGLVAQPLDPCYSVRASVCASVRPCVPAEVRPCVRASVRPCVRGLCAGASVRASAGARACVGGRPSVRLSGHARACPCSYVCMFAWVRSRARLCPMDQKVIERFVHETSCKQTP